MQSGQCLISATVKAVLLARSGLRGKARVATVQVASPALIAHAATVTVRAMVRIVHAVMVIALTAATALIVHAVTGIVRVSVIHVLRVPAMAGFNAIAQTGSSAWNANATRTVQSLL